MTRFRVARLQLAPLAAPAPLRGAVPMRVNFGVSWTPTLTGIPATSGCSREVCRFGGRYDPRIDKVRTRTGRAPEGCNLGGRYDPQTCSVRVAGGHGGEVCSPGGRYDPQACKGAAPRRARGASAAHRAPHPLPSPPSTPSHPATPAGSAAAEVATTPKPAERPVASKRSRIAATRAALPSAPAPRRRRATRTPSTAGNQRRVQRTLCRQIDEPWTDVGCPLLNMRYPVRRLGSRYLARRLALHVVPRTPGRHQGNEARHQASHSHLA